ncbi:MAG: hypothetical protein PW735_10965 [Acidobacteriaceae bacterium]|nr:hypothetical protein [Acidobacteriaceae bacterium]
MRQKSSWAGKLVVSAGSGVSSSGICAAVALAGGACLAIDSDAASVRSIYREGGVDFFVNSLDEALRALKNEVRQGRPIAVALAADPAIALGEYSKRGVLADLAVNCASFRAREHVAWLGTRESVSLTQWLLDRGWSESVIAGKTEWHFGPEDVRLRWVNGIARYQRSAAREPRVVWLAEAERTAYTSSTL